MPKSTIKHRRCPECGDHEHLYGRADVRWSFEKQHWIICDAESQIDCTNCGWSGDVEETIFADEGAEDA